MHLLVRSAGVFAALVLCTGLVQAAGTITYEESGTVIGSIGGTDFDAPVTFYLVTDGHVDSGGVSYISDFGSSYLSIPSLGITATGDAQWDVYANKTGGYGGFFDNTANNYLLDINSGLIGNDLTTPFSVTSSGFVGTGSFSTSEGTLILSSLVGNTTFSAVAGDQSPSGGGSSTPEPATSLLLALGLFGTAVLGRNYLKNAAASR